MDKKEQDNIGLPLVDSTPVGIVGMEGNFFRGLTGNSTPRSRGLKIAIIIFATIFFLVPGLILLGFMISIAKELWSDRVWTSLLPVIVGIGLTWGGIAVIKTNLK